MGKNALIGAVLYTCLLVAPPARAVIQVGLEDPQDTASGIDVVRGFAFIPGGGAVTVKLRVNGETTEVEIPCCGPRQDVVNVFGEGTPLNSGFGLLQNYGNFPPGVLSIGVEVSAPGETPVTIDRSILVTKPGARSGEPSALFSFLSDLNIDNANVAIDAVAGEIIVAPVAAVDGGAGGTRQATIRLGWSPSTQRFGIVSAASDTSFAAVQQIFTSRCATFGCHDSVTRAQGQDLSAGQAFRNIVAIKSTEDASRFRVNPGDAMASYLYQKIIEGGNIAPGTVRMPFGCTTNCLSQDEINTIGNWINSGGAPPQ